ncbi:MAG: MCE family protein, partial [Microbacterium sp.]
MLTKRTKNQLMIFVFISLIGISYVGARYARLDRLVYDSSYQVTVSLPASGGIFTGAEVTYRGVQVGSVSDMTLTRDGVDVELSVDNKYKIPADAHALVGNKSAVGEQYVELQPQSDTGPYLKDKSVINAADTEIPVSTTEILTNLDR